LIAGNSSDDDEGGRDCAADKCVLAVNYPEGQEEVLAMLHDLADGKINAVLNIAIFNKVTCNLSVCVLIAVSSDDDDLNERGDEFVDNTHDNDEVEDSDEEEETHGDDEDWGDDSSESSVGDEEEETDDDGDNDASRKAIPSRMVVEDVDSEDEDDENFGHRKANTSSRPTVEDEDRDENDDDNDPPPWKSQSKPIYCTTSGSISTSASKRNNIQPRV
jgi:hypothetical protein